MSSPEYSPPGPSTVDNLLKPDDELIADVAKQEIRNAIHSQRSLFDTQFERHVDGTFNESNFQTILDGNSIDFLCDDLGLGNIDPEVPNVGNFLWDDVNNRMENLLGFGVYLVTVTINMRPSNIGGELVLTFQDDPATIPVILGGSAGLENASPNVFAFAQSTSFIYAPQSFEGVKIKFSLASFQMNTDVAERRIDIVRVM